MDPWLQMHLQQILRYWRVQGQVSVTQALIENWSPRRRVGTDSHRDKLCTQISRNSRRACQLLQKICTVTHPPQQILHQELEFFFALGYYWRISWRTVLLPWSQKCVHHLADLQKAPMPVMRFARLDCNESAGMVGYSYGYDVHPNYTLAELESILPSNQLVFNRTLFSSPTPVYNLSSWTPQVRRLHAQWSVLPRSMAQKHPLQNFLNLILKAVESKSCWKAQTQQIFLE